MASYTPELVEALLEFTSDFIMVANERGEPVLFNRAYAEIIREALGVEMQPGMRPHAMLSDPEGVAFWDELHRRVLGGEQFSVEVAQEFPGGVVRHFSFSFNPITIDGKVTGFCEQSQEITDRVRAEEALRESERQLRESQEVAHIGSYHLNLSADHWTSSPILDSIFGIDADHPHSVESWVAMVHPTFRETMRRYFLDEVVGMKQPFDREYMIVRQNDGAERWVHGLGRLELDDAGEVVAMIGTIHEITDRKEMEDRLRQQEKLEAIGQLAGGVAHDFNNQLMTILGSADLLLGEVQPDSRLALYAENILTGAKRAADLTSQLLAFSRKGKYITVPVDLHRILSEVVSVLQHTIDKRIAIRQHLRASPAITLGDPSQLQNAVLNLALNARDAMPEGGEIVFASDLIELDADACAQLPIRIEPGTYVCLSVTDTGMGIDRKLHDRIFEPFFTTKDVGQGTGMGLAAVYGTIEHHHGSVELESEPGHGATFRLYLPLSKDALPTMPETPSFTKKAPPATHVLLVDDEPDVRRVTTAMLKESGMRVTSCADGAEAVQLYLERWQEFDVVILDMVMPVLGGRDAFMAMREINPEIRALLSSGYSLEPEAQSLLGQGVVEVIQKPFHIRDLQQKIAELCSEP